jgi:hypothetical protein
VTVLHSVTFSTCDDFTNGVFLTLTRTRRPLTIELVIFATPDKPLRIPYPSAIMPWRRDEHGRQIAKIPIAGTIMRLEGDALAAAREQLKNPDLMDGKPPILFEVEFSCGERGLFTPIEGPFAYGNASTTGIVIAGASK